MANFQVNLLFKADTTAATNNIQQLGSLLTDISTKTKIGVDNGSLSQAVTSAQQLSIHLQNAMNQNTGKLDLSKLNASLKSAGTDLQTLTTQLRGAGPAGEQAFIKVATAVASAEAPMIRINQRLKDFGITLANTVKWQIASTAIHGISGMLSSAVGHAEDLNKALNDIRIVTGYGVDTMSQFAVEASNAARELSTTTTEYAKAALIFYQQGLNGDAVTERANVVVKLSQVTRQSAEQVSSQMTAIWNNFDDGTKSLEYYADALTKLGAATAASTDEISDGLEKFAAIAETVGLSYEYAAAAVATVIDKTRQSADVVGTAFKTIFARMQGLSLGDTLEDGVDLNKYSAALEKVGVDVLTADGELRKMDEILDELGEKWQGFGDSTKVALAQTVAGVRQYNQMISLMDNWDSVKENIDLATNATGELTKQQEIWSESYEAASNRVKQAQNELYEKFINDKSIVRLNDIFAQLIQTVGGVIDKMGGILPMVLTFAGVFSKHLFPLLQSGFKQLANNIAVLTGKATQDLVLMQNSMRLQMQDTMANANISDPVKQQIALSENLLVAKQKLTIASKNMSAAELEEAQSRMRVYESLVAETQQALQRQAQLEREIALQRESLTTGTNKKNLAENAARNDFHKWHGSMSGEYVDEIFDEATTFTPREIQQQQQQSQQRFADRKASINAQLEDARTVPTSEKFPETARAEAVKALLAELDAVEEEEQAQIERYKLIEEMQSRIAGQKRKKGEDISVGTTETYTDAMETEHGASMTAKAVSDIGGSADDGLIEVDASISNLEALYQKMGEYNTQANTMGTMAKELNSTFMSTDGSLNANVLALQNSVGAMGEYQSATEAVDQAQSEYDAAVRKVTEAQQAAQKAGKKDAQATKNLADAKADLKKKEEQLASAQSKQKAALDKGTNAGQNYVKQLISMKGALIQAAQSAGGAQDDIDKINKAFEDLGSGDAQKAAQGLQAIQEQMLKFQSGSSEAVAGLDNIAAAIQERLLGSGMNPAQLQAFIDNLVKMGVISPDVANKLRIVGDAGANLGPRVKSGADLAVAGISAMATAAGQMSMAVSGIQMFIGAFEEGLSPMQRFAQIMGSLPMILGAVGAAIKLVNGLKQRHTLITSGTTAATLAQMAAENKLILSEGALAAISWVVTAAEWAKNAAIAFGKALMGDYGALAAAAAAAGLVMAAAAVTGAIMVANSNQELSEAQQEANKATIEQTEKTNALTNAWADQMSVMDELIAKYEALRRAGGDYGEATEDIINAVPEVIDAYNELAEGLDLNPEQLEKFNELIKEMRQGAAQGGEEGVAAIQQAQSEMDALLSPEASAAAKEGAKAAMSQTAQAIVDVGDAKWENNKVTRHVGGYATQFRSFYDDDGNLLATNEEDAAGKLLEKHGVGTWDSVLGGYNVALDTSSTENFVEDYESLLAAQKEMEAVLGDAADNSDTYREISDMLKGSEEEYQKLAEMQAEAEKFGVIDAKVALEEQGKTLEGIDSYGAYDEYRTELVKQMQADNPNMSAEEAEAAADAWLRAQGAVEEYVKAEDKMGFAASKAADEAERQAIAQGKSTEEAEAAGKAAEDARMKELKDLYADLDEEDQTFFMNVDFNKYESEAAIKAEIERLQSVAEGEKIQLKIDQIASAQSTLKEDGMSTEDWSKIQNETLTWGEEGIISFNEFLNMTYEQQSQYLADQMQASQNAFIATKQAAVNELKSSLSDPEISQEEQSSIQAEIDALEAELAIAEKIRQERWETAQQENVENQDIDYDEYKEYAEYINSMDGIAKMYAGTAEKIALAEKLQGKAVEDLVENYSDYADLLKKASLNPQIKGTEQYSKAISALRKDLTNLTGVSEDIFTEEFLNSEEAQKALADVSNGVDGAVEKFKALAVTEELKQITIKAGLEIDEETFTTLYDELAALNNEDIEIGTKINDSEALNGLYNLMTQAGMSVGQIQEMFNNLGWEPEIEYEEVDATTAAAMHAAGYQEYAVMNPDGSMSIHSVPLDGELVQGADQKVYIPKIVPANKGGGFTKIDPPGTTSSSKPSGGGGGGGSKPTLKNDQSKERYHTLQNQLEDLKSEYDDISQAADRAFGKDKLKLMDDQLKKTDEMIEKQEEYLAAISADLPKDKAIMEAYYSDLIDGPAIEFDENGNISNFDAIQDAMYATYNANAENMSAEDWEVFEEKYGKLEEYIAQYEETYDLLREEEKAYQDLINQRMDEQLAIIQYQVDLKVDVADDALEVLEFQLSRLEDNAFSAAEAIALMGDQTELLMDKVAANTQGIQDILGQQLSSSELERFVAGDASVLEGKEFTQDQVDALRNYRSELLSLNQDLLQVREDVQSKVMDTFDAWNEKLQKGIDKFDHYSSVLTSYKNIVDLVGKSYLGVDNELLKSMNDAMIENSINKVGATRAAYEALLESQANAQAQYEAAVASGNENDIKFWSDTLEAIGEEVDAAQENMMAAWEESLQLAAEEFQRQVDVALEEFNTALTGFASLEEFRENFDFAKEVEEEYVPAYEKIYELSKLNRDINKTLNDDRVIKGKEKLLELQEKINQYQQDGVEMSEYEIANLQREYDLRMAEIALEEARNAKDTVRMSKDNEGNWSYVYTTNTEAVDTAQQDYEDALFAMQQANDEYLDEMSNLILDATQRMNEEIAALRLEDFANQQEYDAAVQAITDKYMGRIKYGQEQMQLAINNNADLYQNDWTAYSEATGYKIATDEEYVDSFNETVLGKLLNSESQVVNVYDMINDQIGGLLEATSGAYADWSGQVDAANQAAGTSTDGFAEDMDNAINGPGGIAESSEDAADSVYDMAKDMIDDFDRVAQAVSDWQRSYSNDIDAIIEKNLDAIEVCNALLAVLSDVQDVDLSNLTPTYDPYGKTYDNTTNSKDKDEEVVVVPVEQRDRNTTNPSGGGGRDTGIDTQPWRREASVTHFASGGYTGEWGDDGRLAVLHQKELVLNAEDTANMFKALNLTKQILDTIDLNAQHASGGLGQVMASSIRDAITQTLDQHVTIEAEFPSVTDHNEIEIAMKNLINTASQFAHRK